MIEGWAGIQYGNAFAKSYGFHHALFYCNANYDGKDTWPTATTWYRMQNIHLPMYSVGDTLTVWAIYNESD